MNLNNEKEPFEMRHPYFFSAYTFKLEGLKSDVRKKYENLIKTLEGTVCDDGEYILTEKSYFNKLENQSRNDLYDINYISESMKAEYPLDIQEFRFLPENISKFSLPNGNCQLAKKISQADLCASDCIRSGTSNVSDNIVQIVSNIANCLQIDIVENIDTSFDTNDFQLNREKDSQPKKGSLSIEMSSDSEEELKSSPKTKHSTKKKKITSNLNTSSSSDEIQFVFSSSDEDDNREKKKPPYNNTKIIDFDKTPNNTLPWWDDLPPAKTFTGKLPNGRSGTHHKGSHISKSDQKLMITYLNVKKFYNGCSTIIWKQAHQEGYFCNRSVETLRNNFKRSILPNLHEFGLPQEILEEFLGFRN